MKTHYPYYIVAFLVSLILTIFACNKQKNLSTDRYIKWVEDIENGLKKEKKIGDFSYRCFYKPASYIALRETVNSGNKIEPLTISKRESELQKLHQFNFDIVSKDGKHSVLVTGVNSQEEQSARVNYFVSHAQQDFKLIQGQDTLPCVLYHFEQTFGLSPLNTIVLGFEKKENKEGDLQLIYDSRLLNNGEIKFLYTESKIKNIPRLKF